MLLYRANELLFRSALSCHTPCSNVTSAPSATFHVPGLLWLVTSVCATRVLLAVIIVRSTSSCLMLTALLKPVAKLAHTHTHTHTHPHTHTHTHTYTHTHTHAHTCTHMHTHTHTHTHAHTHTHTQGRRECTSISTSHRWSTWPGFQNRMCCCSQPLSSPRTFCRATSASTRRCCWDPCA
jgi:hypothetical protein